MTHIPDRVEVAEVYELLARYGPATAYDYMQRAGGVQQFPLSLIQRVRMQIEARYFGAPQLTPDTAPSTPASTRSTRCGNG